MPLKPSPHRRGPKTEIGEPVTRVNVMLDERTVRLLGVLGGGNVSRGVREAARVAYAAYQRSAA